LSNSDHALKYYCGKRSQMTSTSPPAYPAEYYYPKLTDSRSVDLHVSPPPLATPVTTTKNLEQTKKTKQNLPIDIITGHGLPNANPPGSPLKRVRINQQLSLKPLDEYTRLLHPYALLEH
jgi:hypothetical protein